MATSNQLYANQLVGHLIGLQRMGSGITQRLIRILNRTDRRLELLLRQRLSVLEERGGLFDEAGDRELVSILRAVNRLRSGNISVFRDRLIEELMGVMAHEVDYNIAAVNNALPFSTALAAVEPQRFTAVLRTKIFPFNLPPRQRRSLRRWIDTLQPAELRRIQATVQTGFTTGQTTDDIVRQIVGTRANQFRDGIIQQTRANAATIVRTSTNVMAQEARNLFFRQNNLAKEEVWTAVLDGRTTFVCMSRDGEVRPFGGWQARYPAHFGERSTIIPILDGVGIIGDRPTITDTRNRRRREIDFRRIARETNRTVPQVRRAWADRNVGRAPPEVNFERWLRDQPQSFQREYLGATRFRLFNQGGLRADQLVDRSGNTYTLKQLVDNDRASFVRAGINPDNF